MPRNNSGTYTLASAAFTTLTTISSSAVNNNLSDIATALTQSLATTGVSVMTAAILGFAGTVSLPGFTTGLDPTTGFYRKSANVWAFASSGVEIFDLSATGVVMKSPSTLLDRSGLEVLALPAGTMFDYTVAAAPNGWLLCNGQAVSQTTYAALSTAIGTTYGNPGGGNFNLPDCRGRVTACLDNLGGTAAGRLSNNATNGVDGTALANVGGLQNLTIAQANIPSYTLTNNMTISLSITGNTVYNQFTDHTGSGGTTFRTGTASSSITGSVTGSVTSGGSGTAINTVQPTFILNKIIYTGVYA